MSIKMSRDVEVFNRPLEAGMRSLVLLVALQNRKISLQTLIYLDHFLLHSGDFENGPESLHPDIQFRTGKILIRRELIQIGLNLLVSKQLALKIFNENGIFYTSSEISSEFLTYFDSPYYSKMKVIADWISQRFGKLEESSIHKLVLSNIDRWGSEFSWERYEREV